MKSSTPENRNSFKQIFIFGGSSAYGVGAPQGWGDLVKQYVHTLAYEHNQGEQIEVYNFALSGTPIEFTSTTLTWIMETYVREGAEVIIIASIGGNDSKAVEKPDNFISTPDEFRTKFSALLDLVQRYSNRVLFVASSPLDESKLNPKHRHDIWPDSYWSNERRDLFNDIVRETCEKSNVPVVGVNVDRTEWIRTYLYKDGLHPNQAGYDMIFDEIKRILDKWL